MARQARQPSGEMPEATQAQPPMTEAQGHNPVAEDHEFADLLLAGCLTILINTSSSCRCWNGTIRLMFPRLK